MRARLQEEMRTIEAMRSSQPPI
ncbi:uncharacterized protein G2W53_042040 [Senna tora]|uniref:Uncharacterized protein n=1 Tax=Senna tora TaxID=362788 RepID=A0A834SG52_9FABA|nr:uncharacterized protein G2W53_042040 [Senna tora]